MKSLGWAITRVTIRRKWDTKGGTRDICTQKECQMKRVATWQPRGEASGLTSPDLGLAASRTLRQ